MEDMIPTRREPEPADESACLQRRVVAVEVIQYVVDEFLRQMEGAGGHGGGWVEAGKRIGGSFSTRQS